MKRIVFITSNLTNTGGLEKLTVELANEFAKAKGYEVEIINQGIKKGKERYDISQNIKISYVGIDNSSSKNRLDLVKNLILSYIKLKAKTKQLKDNQIVIGMGTNASYLLPYICGKNDILIGTQHNPVRHSKLSDLFRRFTINKLHKYIVLDKETKKDMSINCRLNNIEVIPNPLTINPVGKSNLKSKSVLAIGRLTDQKGFDLLIQSWRDVINVNPDWKLTIVGEGPKYDSLIKEIKLYGLEDSICIKPFTTEICKYYKEASIFALSSRYEGFGLVILEAQSFGVPVVAFDCPTGPRNIINHGVDGYLVETENIYDLSNKINKLIEEESLRVQFGENAIKNIEKFKIENIMKQWNSLISDLIEKNTN